MAAQVQRFIVATDDPSRTTLWADYTSTQTVNLAGQVRNDRTLAFTVEPVISNPFGSSSLLTADFEATDTFQVAVGLADQAPTAGTFKLTVRGSTTNLTALAFDITAANLQTPISAAFVADAKPACTVTALGNGTFRIRASAVGAVATGSIVSDAVNLIPTCDVVVSEVSLGSASTYYIFLLSIRQAPVALASPVTLLADTVISNTVTQVMSATLPAINTVGFTIDPTGGTFSVSAYALGVTTSCGTADALMSAADFQTLLENHPSLVGNVSVSKSGTSFVVQFIAAAGPKTITASTVDAGALTIITTAIPHGYVSGMTVTHSGTNSTPTTDGARMVTVLTATTYSVPVDVTVAGTTGVTRDSTAPLLTVVDIDLISPQGVSGTINFNTENLMEYSVAQTDETFDLLFSITRTRASGEVRTIYGPTAITLSKDIVEPGSLVPTPLPSYYTAAASDARFAQLAAVNVFTVDQDFSADINVVGSVNSTLVQCSGLVSGAGVFSSDGLGVGRVATATDYTVLLTDCIIGVTSTASARVVTLPNATTTTDGQIFIVKDQSGAAGTNNITVKSAGGTLDGVAAGTGVAIATNFGSLSFYSNLVNWFIF